MKFEFDNNMPIYIQLVNELKKYIISGKFKPGERLPSVRELAMQNKVNPNTMQKALSELEEMGLIYTERTNGKFVTTDSELIKKKNDESAIELTREYLANMMSLGIAKEQVREYLKKLEEMNDGFSKV